MSYLQPLEFNECIVDSPSFREKLLQHEKEIDSSYKVFKEIYNSIKSVFKTLEDCSNAFKELAENLTKYIHKEDQMFINSSHAETEDEKTIKLAVSMYSEMISNIEMMRNEHILGATKTLVFNDLQKLKDDCLSKSKQETKEFRKVTTNYYAKLERYVAIKYKSDGDFKNVDAEIMEDRRQYASRALDHVMTIQQTEEQKTCKLVHTLSLLIQMLNTYHHQAWDHFGDQKKKVDQINCALFRAEESYNTIAENSEALKQKKLSLPLEQIQSNSDEGSAIREGYLFVFTKKTVISDIWTRNFCVYERNSKKLTLTPYNQTNSVSGSKLQSEEFMLLSCERKKSNSIDRRFCFDLKVTSRSTPIILQALSAEDLKLWLDIMDGKEPVYLKSNSFGKLQEIETILNEKGLRFLSMCFDSIERRGLENQGLYRTSGRVGYIDKIMKKIADDLRNSNNMDIMSEKELENLEINILCSMVKSYIKYLRAPMATFELYDDFISAGKLQNYEDKFNAVVKIIKNLPKDNFKLFSILFRHLKIISESSDKNLMTAPNLGVCFSPTIFRPEQVTASLTAIRESKFAGDVITILIERCDDYFPLPTDQIIRPTRLTASKSMYMNRTKAGDQILNSDLVRSQLELPNPNEASNSSSNNISPKAIPKRSRTEHKSSDPTGILRPNTIKTPIIPPRPDISKVSAAASPTPSPKLSPTSKFPRKLDSQKLQQFENNNRQKSFKRAKTLYLYVAENEFQLSFDPNKIVTNVTDSEDTGWIIGTIDGRNGLIPKSYVEILPS